jgi:hypothetical protein
MTALRAIVHEIVLTPKDGELAIELAGDLAVMLAAASPRSISVGLRTERAPVRREASRTE